MGQPKKKYDDKVLEERRAHGNECIEEKCWSDRVAYTPPKPYKPGRQQHRPYGEDVDKNLKKLITEAFDNMANEDLNKVCQCIADGALDALGFVAHDNTFFCLVVDSKKYDA